MVSASKLQRIRPQLAESRRMYTELSRVLTSAAAHLKAGNNVYVKEREVKSSAYMIFTGDRGLCGSYNMNITKWALSYIHETLRTPGSEKIIAVGLHGWEYLQNRGLHIHQGYTGLTGTAAFKDAELVGHKIIEQYLSGEFDEIYVLYTRYDSALELTPIVKKLLPLPVDPESVLWYESTRFEPDVNNFLDHAAPLYADTLVYHALTESAVCEHTARMTSMQASTNNADEILETLTREYNRSRQNAVTQDINEIIGGARALRRQGNYNVR